MPPGIPARTELPSGRAFIEREVSLEDGASSDVSRRAERRLGGRHARARLAHRRRSHLDQRPSHALALDGSIRADVQLGPAGSTSPRLAWDGATLATVWLLPIVERRDVFLETFDASGESTGVLVGVSASSEGTAMAPQVAQRGEEYAVAWTQHFADDDERVWVARFARDGVELGARLELPGTLVGLAAREDSYVLALRDSFIGARSLYLASLDADATLGTVEELKADWLGATSGTAFVLAGSDLGLAWTGQRERAEPEHCGNVPCWARYGEAGLWYTSNSDEEGPWASIGIFTE